jgi:hypothetical protein
MAPRERDRSGANAEYSARVVLREITGQQPPTVPPTAKEYERAGLPCFDYYSETPAVEGASKLAGMESVAAMGKSKGDVPLPGNEPVDPKQVVTIHPKHSDQVREGEFRGNASL